MASPMVAQKDARLVENSVQQKAGNLAHSWAEKKGVNLAVPMGASWVVTMVTNSVVRTASKLAVLSGLRMADSTGGPMAEYSDERTVDS